MSIVLDSSGKESGFVGRISPCIRVFESSDSGRIVSGDRRFPSPAAILSPQPEEEEEPSCSSSIGRNSNFSGRSSEENGGDDETEAQSSYKGPLDTMDALEDSLPIKRGMSKFYCGKSKSFTLLADAASLSASDLAKPENSHNRKRKNMLVFNHLFYRNRNSLLRHSWGSISKKQAHSSRSTLALAVAMSSSGSNTSEESESARISPLHPQRDPALNAYSRSISLMNLHSASNSPSVCSSEQHFFH